MCSIVTLGRPLSDISSKFRNSLFCSFSNFSLLDSFLLLAPRKLRARSDFWDWKPFWESMFTFWINRYPLVQWKANYSSHLNNLESYILSTMFKAKGKNILPYMLNGCMTGRDRKIWIKLRVFDLSLWSHWYWVKHGFFYNPTTGFSFIDYLSCLWS